MSNPNSHDLKTWEILLCIHAESSDHALLWDNTAYPGKWCHAIRSHVFPSSSGYVSSLKSLERKGLIKRPKIDSSSSANKWRYYYEITEDGLLAYEKIREAGRFVE